MEYKFIDDKGTFVASRDPGFSWYLPLADREGRILCSISPNLSGDIKKDDDHFLTVPASSEDLRSSYLCRREFFINISGSVRRISQSEVSRYEAGILYQKLTKKAGPLAVDILNFVPFDLPAEVMRITIRNNSKKPVAFTPTSFIPLYGRSEKNLRDHRHVSSLLNRVYLDRFGIMLKPTMVFDEKGHRINPTVYFCFGYEGGGRSPAGQFPTLDVFYGNGDIMKPDAVEKNIEPFIKKDRSFDGKESCAGLRFGEKILSPGQEAVYVIVMGIAESVQSAKKIFTKLRSPSSVEKSLAATREYWNDYLSSLEFDFGDKTFDGWLTWVKLQPTLRRIFGCSFLPHFDYGKGGRGWRDLWQDALTLLLTEPDRAKSIIENSFKGVRLDGSNATIITSSGGFIADRNRISRVWMDHGVWPYLTARAYIHRSGDPGVLLKDVEYFRDHQLRRARSADKNFEQKDFVQRDSAGASVKGTILEHLLVQNLVQFFNAGKHNIVRLENADWNDGLDMAPDLGESVTFSFMYAHNLADICDLIEELKRNNPSLRLMKELKLLLDTLGKKVDYDDPAAKQQRLLEYFEAVEKVSGEKAEISAEDLIADLKSKSRHLAGWLSSREWMPEGFFNGYYDNKGSRVDGKRAGRVRMMLPPQVFAIMSGVAAEDRIPEIWKSVKKYLFDKDLGGFRLNTDPGGVLMDLGRAYGFSYGDKENGAFFSHMNVMFANALYSREFAEEGSAVMSSIYRMALNGQIPPVLPEYFNGQGKGLYLYLTGSASWYVHTLVSEVLGINYRFGDIRLHPRLLMSDFFAGDIRVSMSHSGKKAVFIYRKPVSGKGPFSITGVKVNGRQCPADGDSALIKASLLTLPRNTVEIIMG